MGLGEKTEKIKMHAFKRDWTLDYSIPFQIYFSKTLTYHKFLTTSELMPQEKNIADVPA